MDKCPKLFQCPSANNKIPSATNYVAVVGDSTLWPNNHCVKFDNIHDGAANTIMLVEVADSDINWMEPRDLSFDQATVGVNVGKHRGFNSNHPGIVIVAYADGHTAILDDSVSSEALKALFTIAGGEKIDDNGDPIMRPLK
jgi:hypothetical protein